jgi:hypothetical protein
MILDGSNGVTFNDASLQGAAASPFGLKNRIINSDMRIDQRNAGASVSTSSGASVYSVDRWNVLYSQTSKFTVQQNAGSVTPPTGFSNYMGFTSSSAYSLTSTDYFHVEQRIEGFNTADLAWGTANAKTITISFWARSSLTGTFGMFLSNSSGDRVYPMSYSISSANTWEYKTITVAGDTSGTWLTTNGTGIRLVFAFGYGTTYQGTVTNTWNAATFYVPTGAVSVVGTNGATFYITGVQLEIGSTATPFERRLYNQELANCQRYCVKYGGSNIFEWVAPFTTLIATNTTNAYGNITSPVPMRTVPSYTTNAIRLTDENNSYTITSVTSSGNSYGNVYGTEVGFAVASGLTQYRPYFVTANNSTSAYLLMTAEL